MPDDDKTFTFETQYAIGGPGGDGIFVCKDEKHAQAMMGSTSVVLPIMATRVILTRKITPWTVVEGSEQYRRRS